jgi:hypothetical protein
VPTSPSVTRKGPGRQAHKTRSLLYPSESPEPKAPPTSNSSKKAAAPPPSKSSNDAFYKIDAILAVRGSGDATEYLVRWVGYSGDDDSWEPLSALGLATDSIDAFLSVSGAPAADVVARGANAFPAGAASSVLPSGAASTVFDDAASTAANRNATALPAVVARAVRPSDAAGAVLDAAASAAVARNDTAAPPPQFDCNAFLEGLNGVTPTLPRLDTSNLPSSWEACCTTLLPTAAVIHLTSRPIGRLPPTYRWSQKLRQTWVDALGKMAPVLRDGISAWKMRKDAGALTAALLAYLSLPGHIIVNASNLHPNEGDTRLYLPDGSSTTVTIGDPDLTHSARRPPTGEAASFINPHDAAAGRAATLTRRGRSKAAKQTLIGNGVAPAVPATAELMTQMHPFHGTRVIAPEPTGPQASILPTACAAALLSKAGDSQCSPDVFGWSADMYLPVRGLPDGDIVQAVAELTALVASGEVPTSVSFLLTCGTLAAFNKVPAEENMRLTSTGGTPKCRPVNNGVHLLKQSLRLVANSPSGQRVKQEIQTFNLGLGVRAGPEKLALSMRALHLNGHVISTEDAVNGFNSMKRQDMLDATKVMWPEAGMACKAYYGHPSVAFYSFRDHDGNQAVKCILGREGSRMGCVLGSILFDITEHVRIFTPLQRQFPDVIMRALTDDLTPAFPPPTASTNWDSVFQRICAFWESYDSLANPVGLVRNKAKSHLLIPLDAPDPNPALKLQPTRRGVVVAGAPIGSDAFMLEHAQTKVELGSKRIAAIGTLCPNEPQMAMRLLGTTVSNILGYYVRVTPPHITAQIAVPFDWALHNARMDCLKGESGTVPSCSPTRTERAKTIAGLPIRNGGLGHTPLATQVPGAFLAGILSTGDDPVLERCRHHLRGDINHAYQLLYSALGVQTIPASSPLLGVLPPSPDVLALGDFAASFLLNNPKAKPQSIINSVITEHTRNQLRAKVVADSGQVHTSKSDTIHVLAISSRTQLTRVFASSLWHEHNRVAPGPFVAWCRAYLTLPQLLTWGHCPVPDGWDCELETCRLAHGPTPQLLDPSGDHCGACKSAYLARYLMHTKLAEVFVSSAASLGLTAQREPATASLLEGKFSAAQCRMMFPDQATKELKTIAASADALLKEADGLVGATRAAALAKLETLLATVPLKTKGLRVDASLTSVDGKSEVWIDVGTCHPSCKTIRSKEFAFLTQEQTSRSTGDSPLLPAEHLPPTPAVEERVKTKRLKYQPLLRQAGVLRLRRHRAKGPVFRACIVSHTGEFSSDVFETIEFLASQVLRQTRKFPRDDGVSSSRAAALFRTTLKDRIATVIVQGYGNMLRAVGFPLAFTDARAHTGDARI